MSNKIPTAEEFCKKYTRLKSAVAIQDLTECMNEYAKLHVKAALEAAANDTEYVFTSHCKSAMLNAYPENLII